MALKPEYIYQPGRLPSRLLHPIKSDSKTAQTAFGFPLGLMPNELISNSIRRKGMYDLVTAEAIYRLLDDNAHAFDIGAHIGLMSVIMGLRVGAGGQVQSFEPHPAVYSVLWANAIRLNSALSSECVVTWNLAISDAVGEASLFLPDDWSRNTGVARVVPDASGSSARIAIKTRTLDDLCASTGAASPELIKLDVEGQELAVLAGSIKMLAGVRDIVFEDFAPYPSPVMNLLEREGFRIFALSKTAFRPLLASPDRRNVPRRADPNYLATRDPSRASERFESAGWKVLRKLFPL